MKQNEIRERFNALMRNNGMTEPRLIPYDTLERMGYFTAPASAKHHGNHEGGLLEHSVLVAEHLVNLTERLGLTWNKQRSPALVGLFHDICKCDLYQPHQTPKQANPVDGIVPLVYEYETTYTYTKPDLCGHGDKSIAILSTLITLTPEEVMCIRFHMGAFTDTKEWEFYSRACHNYPNVLWTHTADMIASQVEGT